MRSDDETEFVTLDRWEQEYDYLTKFLIIKTCCTNVGQNIRSRHSHDLMVVGFITTYAIIIIKIKSKFYNFDHKYQLRSVGKVWRG
jgi:hypothetical protein